MGEDKLNLKLILSKVRKYWYIFALIFPVVLALAYLYLRFTPSSYEAEAMLLIKDEEKSGQPVEEVVFKELGLGVKNKNLENEVFVLKSSPLMEEVVKNLELQYSYFSNEGFIKRDLHTDSPVKVINWEPKSAKTWLLTDLTFTEKGGYRLEFDKKDYPELGEKNEIWGEFGKELRFPLGQLTLTRTDLQSSPRTYSIIIAPLREKAKELSEMLEIEPMGTESSVLKLSIKDVIPTRAEAILTNLLKEYNEQSIEDKNLSYKNSLDLLNERINMITAELGSVERDVESYKRQYNMMELSAEGSLIMQELADYNKTISGIEVQLEILEKIESFLEKNSQTFEFVPTNLTINNLTLTSQLENFNRLLADRARERNRSGPAHPDVLLYEKQIQNLRVSIIESISNIKSDLLIARNSNDNLKENLQSRMQSLPRHERELIEIERRKGIKENLYLYLLQKREEAAISMSVTVPNGKLIEPAEAGFPVSPKPAQVILIALFLGIAIPAGLTFLLDSINDKVQVEDDIQRLTSVPLVGMLAHSSKNGSLVIKEKSRSVEAEMFRLLRANLSYIAPGEDLRKLLITSSVSGEGKSYIALNLGVTQALTGKKVLLLELDLRKPKQELYMNSSGSNGQVKTPGVVDYLVNPSIMLNQIIKNSGLHPNLDFIGCGTKPPNPSELILSDRLRQMIKILDEQYDFIILDAPPVGLVADALQMKDLTEATMYVVRAGYTRKGHLQIIKDIAQKDKLPKLFAVMNDVSLNGTGIYSGGYGYAYASKNGYYEKE